MELSPLLYRMIVRPKLLTKHYISDNLTPLVSFDNKKVLDFGCGVGSNCTMFHSAGYVGIDIDRKRVDYAKKLFPRYRFEYFDGAQIPLPDNSVDYVVVIAVLHHIPNQQLSTYVREFRRVLNADGQILVMEPCLCRNKLNNWFMQVFDNGQYIRNQYDYQSIFEKHKFITRKMKEFKKMFLYNEILFTARPR